MLVHQFDLIALEHRDIHKLAGFLAAVMLDDEQPRRRHFQHKTKLWNGARSAPDRELVSVGPDAQMNPGPLDCRRYPRKGLWSKRQRSRKHERMHGLFRR